MIAATPQPETSGKPETRGKPKSGAGIERSPATKKPVRRPEKELVLEEEIARLMDFLS
jgi:hypothetical protein